jgi:PTH1 family peptidyl-tRNA hydrolase
MPLFGSSTQKLVPVFVASLGNPAPYTTTLHSAGHTVLAALAAQQAYNPWRPFSGGKIAERSERAFNVVTGYSNAGPRRLPTLWKCGSMMNISGPAVKKAFLKWKSEQNFSDDDPKPKLVVIHDELESELGAVRVRTDPKASARGHNGLKSLMSALPNEKWIRIGVGIGRPASRERDAVSDYVLRKMNAREQAVLEQAAAEVSRQLGEIEEGAVS